MNKRGKGTLAVVQTLSEVHPELRRQISSSRCGFYLMWRNWFLFYNHLHTTASEALLFLFTSENASFKEEKVVP